MREMLVLTFIAKDRPGLVETLSETVAQAGGNWLESRMAHLAEKFAGIARVEIAPEGVDSLETALQALGGEGFELTIERARADAESPAPAYEIDLLGPDHPGIVRDLSAALAERHISVEEMKTDIREAPVAGGTLFHASLRVAPFKGINEDELRQALDDLADALMVDLTFEKVR